MARHISSQFRQEYILAGQDYCSSTSVTENENVINKKRKDLSSSDLEVSSVKIAKSKLFLEYYEKFCSIFSF